MNHYHFYNRSEEFRNKVIEILENRKQEVLEFFEVEDRDDFYFDVYVYDTIEELVKEASKRSGITYPPHMCACHIDNDHSLNYFEPKEEYSENEWNKEAYINKNVIFHELVHGIEYKLYDFHPEWLTEGNAKYLDETYKKGIECLMKNYIINNPVPPMSDLVNNYNDFRDENQPYYYDAYDYSYLIVNYLIEIYGKHKYIELLKHQEIIEKWNSMDLTNMAVEYYKNKYNLNKLEEYLNQSEDNPKYLFHGSPIPLTEIKPMQSHDDSGNKNNIEEAVFLFPLFEKSVPYAFKDTIKSQNKYSKFIISNHNDDVLMTMENVGVDDELEGYIYVFENNEKIKKDERSLQYKSYDSLKAIDVIKVKYGNFKDRFEIINNKVENKLI